MGRSKKKSVANQPNLFSGMKKRKPISGAKPKKYKTLSGSNETSARFKMITERAKKIRQAHPKMQWKSCVKQASRELFR